MTADSDPEDWVPDACTLPTAEQPVRVAEFDDFFAASARGSARPSRTRLEVLLAEGAEPVARDLAARETNCCSFFTFGFETGTSGTVMRVEVPPTYAEILDAFEQRVHIRLSP